ncbi:MAG TPA: FlgD immunoglobulin-like domain containing protein [Bacteroidota bacterium]|nr:FlgD immunoglobulin-like domain containing protein [Bacteroidota bacterium]
MTHEVWGRRLIVACLCQALLRSMVPGQTAMVSGTVSATGVPVRSASVTFQDSGVPPGTWSGVTDSSGHYRISVLVTSLRQPSALPAHFTLGQNYPNPFSSATVMPYQLARQSEVVLTVYDILGRVVRKIVAGTQAAGAYGVVWDGTNGEGERVAGGVYFYTLASEGQLQARKMVFAGGGAPLSLGQGGAVSPAPAGAAAPAHVQAGPFSVRIDNTETTSPWIATTLLTDVAVAGDTTLDFAVSPLPVAAVTADSVQQVIRGFGAANILPWRPDMTAGEVQAAFGAGPGQVGLTILRLRIPYTDTVTDFSAQVPTAQLAESLGAIVFATPWTPPPALKTNDNIVGGMLADSSYAAFAAHLKGFADYMAANGAPLYAVSLQNEPDASVTYESCSWNATQFLNFTKNNAAAVGTRIMMPESESFNHHLSDSTLADPVAASLVSIIGGHIYGGGLAPYPLAVSEGKDVWMTEHLSTDTTWAGVLATGKEINDCMGAGMNAYVWWYIVRYYGPIGEDGSVTRRGFVMSQYARFVRPGYHKIKCTAAPQRNVSLTAYADSAKSHVVVVAVNLGSAPVQQAFAVPGVAMTALSVYTTSQSKNCAQGADIPVAGNGFAVSLDASSVTTFVSH